MANPSAAKLRRQANRDHTPDPASSTEDLEAVRTAFLQNVSITQIPPAAGPPLSMSSSSSARLLIASLGNPPPLHTTRHSAGHVALKSLVSFLGFPGPQRNASYGGGHVSSSPRTPSYTFYQSPTLMNVSGPTLLKAWKYFESVHGPQNTALVVLHDELELPAGQTKVKRGNGSAKGHNGIKSVQASLQGAGLLERLGQNFVRIGIGIGRPVSRDRDDVSNYVLGRMDVNEKAKIDGIAEELEGKISLEAERVGRG